MQSQSTPRLVRLGLIGIGGYGWTLARWIEAVAARQRCRIVAVADARLGDFPERVRHLRQHAVELFDDAAEMLGAMRGRCDAVYVATGIGSHAPLTIAALRAGFHVHLEKPPAATVQEVDAMLQAIRASGRLCLVGFQAVHSRDIRFLKRRVADGRLGRVRWLTCLAGWPRTRSYYDRNDWAGRLRRGEAWVLDGPATNALAHQMTNMLLLASPEPLACAAPAAVRAELYAAGPVESHDTAAVEIQTAEGARAYFYASHCPESHYGPTIVLDAERGRAVWTMRRGATVRYADGAQETCPYDFEHGGEMIANFVQALRGGDGSRLRCPMEQARKMVLALDGAHESSGRVHRIGPAHVRRADEGTENARTEIVGLDACFRAAAERRCLPSDLSPAPPWAVRTETFDLSGYASFPQRFAGE